MFNWDRSIWKQRRTRCNSIRRRRRVSCTTTQFRPSSWRRLSISKTDQKESEKKKNEEESPSPTMKDRYDHGQLRDRNLFADSLEMETSWHNTKQEKLESRQLREISSTVEIIKENTKLRSLQSTYTKQLGNCFCICDKKFDRLTVVQEKNSEVTIETDCQIIQSLVQRKIPEQVRRSERDVTSKDQKYWSNDVKSFPTMDKE